MKEIRPLKNHLGKIVEKKTMEERYSTYIIDPKTRKKVKVDRRMIDGKNRKSIVNYDEYLRELQQYEGINEKTIMNFAKFFDNDLSHAKMIVGKFLDGSFDEAVMDYIYKTYLK